MDTGNAAHAEGVAGAALALMHAVGGGSSVPAVYSAAPTGHAAAVRDAISRYPFARFSNWGLIACGETDAHAPGVPQPANWFLRRCTDQRREEFERRLAALDRDALLDVVARYCRARFGREVRSLLVFGGYLYGVTPEPDDLDVAIVLHASEAVENDLSLRCDRLGAIVRYPRRPRDRVGLTVVGADAIHPQTLNSTVLRTAVIAATTAVSLFGPPYQIIPPPPAVLLYHTIEMVTWGFKLTFETSPQAQARALWRVVEASYALRQINDLLGGPLPDRGERIADLERHLRSPEPDVVQPAQRFGDAVDRFREDARHLKEVIRREALHLLESAGSPRAEVVGASGGRPRASNERPVPDA